MQLSAQARYATLKAMGTHLWVPRVQLLGAASSYACDWPAPIKQLSARERLLKQQAAVTLNTALPALAITQKMVAVTQPEAILSTDLSSLPLQKLPLSATQPQQPMQSPAVKLPANQSAQNLQPLQANVWLLANGWQLVMENPEGQLGLQEVDIRLLHNLLIALYPGGLGIVNQQVFNWPLPGIPFVEGNEGELGNVLHAFLTGARLQGIQLAGCLVFGERLLNLMQNNTSSGSLRLFACPSLAQLQQNPNAKQDFWQQAGSSGLRAAFASSPVTF